MRFKPIGFFLLVFTVLDSKAILAQDKIQTTPTITTTPFITGNPTPMEGHPTLWRQDWITIQFKPDVPKTVQKKILLSFGQSEPIQRWKNSYFLKVTNGMNIEKAVNNLNKLKEIEFAGYFDWGSFE
jgi:hypothetical protein